MNNLFGNIRNLSDIMKNPQQFIENAINKDPSLKQNEPFMNAYNALQNGNIQQAEQIARNVCQQKGFEPNSIISKLKSMCGRQ